VPSLTRKRSLVQSQYRPPCLCRSEADSPVRRVGFFACRCRLVVSTDADVGVAARVQNSGAAPEGACRSASQEVMVCRVWLVSGVQRSLRPLPRQLRWAPLSRCRSSMVRAISSETRSPVCAVSTSSAWSRRPCQVEGSGADSSASSSSRVRKSTMVLVVRLDWIARTLLISRACSGACRLA
jgi:hypothetical protein